MYGEDLNRRHHGYSFRTNFIRYHHPFVLYLLYLCYIYVYYNYYIIYIFRLTQLTTLVAYTLLCFTATCFGHHQVITQFTYKRKCARHRTLVYKQWMILHCALRREISCVQVVSKILGQTSGKNLPSQNKKKSL